MSAQLYGTSAESSPDIELSPDNLFIIRPRGRVQCILLGNRTKQTTSIHAQSSPALEPGLAQKRTCSRRYLRLCVGLLEQAADISLTQGKEVQALMLASLHTVTAAAEDSHRGMGAIILLATWKATVQVHKTQHQTAY